MNEFKLKERLRQYRGRPYETTECYNGLRDEAAAEIERLEAELDEIEKDGTKEHNAAVKLRAKLARTRARRDELLKEKTAAAIRIERLEARVAQLEEHIDHLDSVASGRKLPFKHGDIQDSIEFLIRVRQRDALGKEGSDEQ